MSTKYAIVGGKLIDGTGAEPVENSLVLVDDNGKIEYAGTMQDLPEGVEVIDAAGKTVLPGLIDTHLHFSGNLTDDDTDWVMQPLLEKQAVAVKQAYDCLTHGLTTVCEIGRFGIQIRDCIDKGVFKARAFWPPAWASAALPVTATLTTAPRSSTRNPTPGATRSMVLGICARPSAVACARTPMPSRSGLPVAASGAGTPVVTSTIAPRRSRPWSKRQRWSVSPCGATATTTTPLPTIPFALAASS